MKRLLNSATQLLLVLVLAVSLSGCVTTHVHGNHQPLAGNGPETQSNLLDVAFTDNAMGIWWEATDDP